MPTKIPSSLLIAAFAAVQLIVRPALGDTKNWISLTDGNWSVGGNWDAGTAPVVGDFLIVDGTQAFSATQFISASASATTSLSAASIYFDASAVSVFAATGSGPSSDANNARILSLGSNTTSGT